MEKGEKGKRAFQERGEPMPISVRLSRFPIFPVTDAVNSYGGSVTKRRCPLRSEIQAAPPQFPGQLEYLRRVAAAFGVRQFIAAFGLTGSGRVPAVWSTISASGQKAAMNRRTPKAKSRVWGISGVLSVARMILPTGACGFVGCSGISMGNRLSERVGCRRMSVVNQLVRAMRDCDPRDASWIPGENGWFDRENHLESMTTSRIHGETIA